MPQYGVEPDTPKHEAELAKVGIKRFSLEPLEPLKQIESLKLLESIKPLEQLKTLEPLESLGKLLYASFLTGRLRVLGSFVFFFVEKIKC